jgi:hypothetical protein
MPDLTSASEENGGKFPSFPLPLLPSVQILLLKGFFNHGLH